MPDVHTQTPMTGNRIDTVLKELGRLRKAKYNRTHYVKKQGRKVQQVDLPDGFQLKFNIRKTGVRKGMKDRYFVTPNGMVLKTKRELDVYLDIWKKE